MFYCYKIVNKVNSKAYIGITKDADKRFAEHLKAADSGDTNLIYRSLRKYGKSNFTFDIIKAVETWKEAQDLEKRFIQEYMSHYTKGGYNMTFGGDGGDTLSNPIAKQNYLKNRNVESAVKNFRKWANDNPEYNQKRIDNMRAALKEKWNDPVFREDQLNNHSGMFRLGHTDSDETRYKKSQSALGKSKSIAHRQNISEGLRGIKRSEDTCAKISKNKKGKVTVYSLKDHTSFQVTLDEFHRCDYLVGIKNRLASIDMAIMSQASQACGEGAETTGGGTNLSRNTRFSARQPKEHF